jgi:hypothetical protein
LQLLDKIEQLLVPISQTLSGEATVPEVLHKFSPLMAEMDQTHQETGQMGRALLERLALPIILVDG